MKTRSILFLLLFSATAFVFLTNCSENKQVEASETHEPAGQDTTPYTFGSTASEEFSKPQFQVDASFQEQLSSVFSSYVKLKDAFVSSDAGKVKAGATETYEALSKVDMKLLSGAPHNDWRNYLSPLQSSLKEIKASEDIESQRKNFSTLSEHLYKSIKAFGLSGKEAFYGFCPMALNNEGAYWLSDQEKIRNPYFGNKMLTCGEVKEKLK